MFLLLRERVLVKKHKRERNRNASQKHLARLISCWREAKPRAWAGRGYALRADALERRKRANIMDAHGKPCAMARSADAPAKRGGAGELRPPTPPRVLTHAMLTS